MSVPRLYLAQNSVLLHNAPMQNQHQSNADAVDAAVIVSAGTEWRVVREVFPEWRVETSPMGDWFETDVPVAGQARRLVFFHGGWGKIAAAASAQYVIDHWTPQLILNFGTCGGFEGVIERGEIILAERTLVYDIIEQMGDFDAAIEYFSTDLPLDFLTTPYPQDVRCCLLVSADRDIVVEDILMLKARYGAVAADWESGAIAWVAARNGVRCLILRGVSDLVGADGGEAYLGSMEVFQRGAADVMGRLLENLAGWLACAGEFAEG